MCVYRWVNECMYVYVCVTYLFQVSEGPHTFYCFAILCLSLILNLKDMPWGYFPFSPLFLPSEQKFS